MRELGSNGRWFAIEFLVYYERNHIRSFAYVRRSDGREIPDGTYSMVDDLGEHERTWKKQGGGWKVTWRKRWDRNP